MKGVVVLAGIWAALGSASGQQPNVINARYETQAFAGNLATVVHAAEPSWIGYAVKTTPGNHDSCCFDNGRRSGCSLEDKSMTIQSGTARSRTPVALEDSDQFSVLLRVANDRVEKIRGFSLDCALDAGGRRFVWITGVPAEASLRFLEKMVTTNEVDSVGDGALFAIAQHEGGLADDILERFTGKGQPMKIRERATFWCGASRGARGLQVLKRLVASGDNEQIRDKAVFGLSISKQPGATEALIDAAKHDGSPHIRGQALFWIAQKAGKQAAETIRDAIDNDPDTEVKKRAVFAMSQLPKEESVPKLIEIARTQRNAEVRKQAFFWLGQSNDPRALAFFQQILAQ